MNDAKIGGVGIWLDEIVPCLKDTETGEIKETVVFKIESRSFLKKFNEIQGLVGVKNDKNSIAADKSIQWGYEGAIHGFALNKKLLKHYIEILGAVFLGALHEYQFFVIEKAAKQLLETYTYEWN